MVSKEKTDMEFFWNRVRILSKARYGGWKGLSEATGISSAVLMKAFHNRSATRGDNVAKIADALGVSAISLFKRSDNSTNSKARDNKKDSIINAVLSLEDDSELLDIVQKILDLPLSFSKKRDVSKRDNQ